MERLTREQMTSLVSLARSGDRGAFDALVRAHHRALVGHIRGRCRITTEDAEAVAQDIWIQAWEEIGTPPESGGYDSERASFYTFITNRYARFYIRRFCSRTHAPAVLLDDALDVTDVAPDGLMRDWDEARDQFDAYCQLFRLTFLCGGYPHQQLVFGYSKTLYGTPSPRGIEGDPLRVDQEVGLLPLEAAFDQFWEDYAEMSGMSASELAELRRCLDPVRVRLPLTPEQLIRPLPSQLEQVRQKAIGETRLGEYYPARGASAAISDWCDKLERRIRALLGVAPSGGCGRCKLRHAPPCAQRPDEHTAAESNVTELDQGP